MRKQSILIAVALAMSWAIGTTASAEIAKNEANSKANIAAVDNDTGTLGVASSDMPAANMQANDTAKNYAIKTKKKVDQQKATKIGAMKTASATNTATSQWAAYGTDRSPKKMHHVSIKGTYGTGATTMANSFNAAIHPRE